MSKNINFELCSSVINSYCVVRVQENTIMKGIYKSKDILSYSEKLFLLFFFFLVVGEDRIEFFLALLYFNLALHHCITHALSTTSKMQHRHRAVFSVQDLTSHSWDICSYTFICRIYLLQRHELTALLNLVILICFNF